MLKALPTALWSGASTIPPNPAKSSTRNQTLSNNDRYTYANTTEPNILVSIHMNPSSDRATNYTTLFGKWRKDKELAPDETPRLLI